MWALAGDARSVRRCYYANAVNQSPGDREDETMIKGVHTMFYSSDADGVRAFLRDKLGFSFTDVGGGWLIFALPPSEVAVHPAERNAHHEMYLMCDDVEQTVAKLTSHGVTCTGIEDTGWGRLTKVTLPSGATIGVYEPKHARAGT